MGLTARRCLGLPSPVSPSASCPQSPCALTSVSPAAECCQHLSPRTPRRGHPRPGPGTAGSGKGGGPTTAWDLLSSSWCTARYALVLSANRHSASTGAHAAMPPETHPLHAPVGSPTGCTGRPHTSVARLEMESQLPSRADNAAGGGRDLPAAEPQPRRCKRGHSSRLSLRFSPRRGQQVQWAGFGDCAGGCPPSPLRRTRAPAPADCTAAPGRTHAVRGGSPLHFILITLETLSSK